MFNEHHESINNGTQQCQNYEIKINENLRKPVGRHQKLGSNQAESTVDSDKPRNRTKHDDMSSFINYSTTNS